MLNFDPQPNSEAYMPLILTSDDEDLFLKSVCEDDIINLKDPLEELSNYFIKKLEDYSKILSNTPDRVCRKFDLIENQNNRIDEIGLTLRKLTDGYAISLNRLYDVKIIREIGDIVESEINFSN
jgi:hypothetical protein